MDKNEKYNKTRVSYDAIVDEYVMKHTGSSSALIRLNQFLSGLPKDSLVLDAGCGHGRDIQLLATLGFKAMGIDYSDEMVKHVVHELGLEAYKMDLLEIDFPDNHFDAILASAVLHHLEPTDVVKVVKDFYRILRPGGHLLVYNRTDLLNTWDDEFSSYPRYYGELSKEKLILILVEQNFFVDKIVEEQKKNKMWVQVFSHK